MVAPPMYGGMCTGEFTNGLAGLFQLAGKYQLPIQFRYMVNESLIPRARNRLAHQFLTETDCSHLMFIDADIGFNPIDILTLSLHAADADRSVVCAAYPKKGIEWDQVKTAVENGAATDDPKKLASLGVAFPVDIGPGAVRDFAIDQPNEVKYAGTGFMMIQRKVFESLEPTLKDQTYFDPLAGQSEDGETVTSYFDCEIDPDTKTYLSEDYAFCKKVGDIGLKIWLCPWIKLAHVGTYTFKVSLILPQRECRSINQSDR